VSTPLLYSMDMAHMISSFLQAKDTLKGNQFEDVETIKLNALQQLFRSQKQSMRGDSSSGTAAGISVSKPNVPTAQGISQDKFCIATFTASVWEVTDHPLQNSITDFSEKESTKVDSSNHSGKRFVYIFHVVKFIQLNDNGGVVIYLVLCLQRQSSTTYFY
jgi:hypothetical protein